MISFVRPLCPPLQAVAVLLVVAPAFAPTSSAHGATAGSSCGAWSIVPSPKSRSATSYVYGVAGTSDRDVWAVGYHADQSGDRLHCVGATDRPDSSLRKAALDRGPN
jgi:hypothetical protein